MAKAKSLTAAPVPLEHHAMLRAEMFRWFQLCIGLPLKERRRLSTRRQVVQKGTHTGYMEIMMG